MKKLFIICLLGVSLFGCSSSKPEPTHSFSCTVEENEKTVSTSISEVYLYAEEDLVSLKQTKKITPSEDMSPIDRKQLMDMTRSNESLYNTIEGIKSTFSESNGVYTLTNEVDLIDADANELINNSIIDSSLLKDKDLSVSAMKSHYKKTGIKCKEEKIVDKK
ncbi:MAG: hypothetical protein RR890_06440 [Longicatena sp.]